MITKRAWLEALNLGHSNPFVQRVIERSIRSNARQGLFDAAGIQIKNDPGSTMLLKHGPLVNVHKRNQTTPPDPSLVNEVETPENVNSDADIGGPNVPKRST